MSHNNNYVSSTNTTNFTVTDNAGGSVTSTDTYQDIFTVATLAQSGLSNTDCATCYVACGCNTANGWSSTQPSGAYHKAVSSIKYNYEITSVNGKSTSSTGTKDLISEGTSRAYSASTTATGDTYVVSENNDFTPTCYKQKDAYYSCVYNWVVKPVTGRVKEYTNYYSSDAYNVVDATFDEYFLDSISCTNSNNQSRITYSSTSSPTLSEFFRSATQRPKFEVNIAYDFISFGSQAKYDTQSELIPASDRGKELSWETTASKGLFSSFDSIKADITFDAYVTTTSYFNNGYVLVKPGKNVTTINLETIKNFNNGYKYSGSTSVFDQVPYIYKSREGTETSEFAVTAGEAATRNLSRNNLRFTNYKSEFGVDSTEKPEIIRLTLSEKNNLKSGGVDYFMSNYTIKKQGKSVLADRIFKRGVDSSTRIYTTYNRTSDGTITSKDDYGYTKTREVYTAIDFNDEYKTNIEIISVNRTLKYLDANGNNCYVSGNGRSCDTDSSGYNYSYPYGSSYNKSYSCPKSGYNSHYRGLHYGQFNWNGLSIEEDVIYEQCAEKSLTSYCQDCYSSSPVDVKEKDVYKDITATGLSFGAGPVYVYRNGYIIKTPEEYDDTTCPSGYYGVYIDTDLFNVTWDATETCYKVNGCRSQLNDSYYKGDIVNLTNSTPERSTIRNDQTAPDGTRCAVYDCPVGYTYSSGTPNTSYFTVIEQEYGSYIRDKLCYKLECAKAGYEAATSLPNDNCNLSYCETYRGYYCKYSCNNHEVYTPRENSDFYCIKKTSSCPGGWYKGTPSTDEKKFFSYETQETTDGTKCYRITGCASGFTKYYTLPTECTDDYGITCKNSSYIPVSLEKVSSGDIDFDDDYTVGDTYYEGGERKFACITSNKCNSGYYFNPSAIMTTTDSAFIYQSQSTDKPYCNKSIGCSRLKDRFYSGFNSDVKKLGCTLTYQDGNSTEYYAQCTKAQGYVDGKSNAFCLTPNDEYDDGYYFYADNEQEKKFITGMLNRFYSSRDYYTTGYQYLEVYDQEYYKDSDFGKLFTESVPSKRYSTSSDNCSRLGDNLMYTCLGDYDNDGYADTGYSYEHQYLAISTNYGMKGRSGKQVTVNNNPRYYSLSNACPYYDEGYTSLNNGKIVDPRVATEEPDTYSVCTKVTCNSGYVKLPLNYPARPDPYENTLNVAAHANLKSGYTPRYRESDYYYENYLELDNTQYKYSPDGVVAGDAACIKSKYCAGTKTFTTKTLIGFEDGTCERIYITPGTWCTKASAVTLPTGTLFKKTDGAKIPSGFKVDKLHICYDSTTFMCKNGSIITTPGGFQKTGTRTITDINGTSYTITDYEKTSGGSGCINDCQIQIASYSCVNGVCCY